MDTVPPTEYLNRYDELNLDDHCNRRLATYILEDYYGKVLASVGEKYLEFDTKTTSQNIKQQWVKARDHLSTLEGVQVPEKYSRIISQLADTRNNVAHNYDKNPSKRSLENARGIAEKWAEWIIETAERFPTRAAVLHRWTTGHGLRDDPVPLFETDEKSVVQLDEIGRRNKRPVLALSDGMKEQLRREGKRVVDDYESGENKFEGLHTMMYWIRDEKVVPLYNSWVSKTSRNDDSLNMMLEGIGKSEFRLARWGYPHFSHADGISERLLDHEYYRERDSGSGRAERYNEWIETLFERESRELRQPVYFWANATTTEEEVGLPGLYSDLFQPHEIIGALGAAVYPEANLDNVGIS